MNHQSTRIVTTVLFALFHVSAQACWCAYSRLKPTEQVQRQFKAADTVAIAEWNGIRKIDDIEFIAFSVETLLKGKKIKDLRIVSETGDCSVTFKPGQRYLLYLRKNPTDGYFYTSMCELTKNITESKFDLKILRGKFRSSK